LSRQSKREEEEDTAEQGNQGNGLNKERRSGVTSDLWVSFRDSILSFPVIQLRNLGSTDLRLDLGQIQTSSTKRIKMFCHSISALLNDNEKDSELDNNDIRREKSVRCLLSQSVEVR
jgi:uncharacterized protein YdgA (DUF945 family)